jgi:hypothetical protein
MEIKVPQNIIDKTLLCPANFHCLTDPGCLCLLTGDDNNQTCCTVKPHKNTCNAYAVDHGEARLCFCPVRVYLRNHYGI